MKSEQGSDLNTQILITAWGVLGMEVLQFDGQTAQSRKLIERGEDFERYQIDERTFQVVLGLPPWIKDDTGKYVPYIVNTYEDHVAVKSGIVGCKIYGDRLEYFDSNVKEFRATERVLVHVGGRTELVLSFIGRDITYGETSVNVSQLYAVLQNGRKIGEAQITYSQRAGSPLEHIVETQGLPNGLAKSVHFIWEFPTTVDEAVISMDEGVDRQKLTIEQIRRVNLNNFENVMITKQGRVWINECTFFNKARLQEMRASSSGIIWIYSGWNDQISLGHAQTGTAGQRGTWGPRYTFEDGLVSTVPNATAACGAANAKDSMGPMLWVRCPASTVNSYCCRAYLEWDITPLETAVPAPTGITGIAFECEVTTPVNARPCDITSLNNRPSTTPAVPLWNDIDTGVIIAGTNFFGAAGANKTLNMNQANADLWGKIGTHWWGFGIKFNAEGRDAAEHRVGIESNENSGATPRPRLTVTYTP